jgi:hypothetical protein
VVVDFASNCYSCQDLRTLKVLKFDVTRLKAYQQDPAMGAQEAAASDEGEYVVDEIVAHRGSAKDKKALRFRVRWRGYEPDEDTWEAYSTVKELAALDAYLKTHPKLRL